MPDLVTRWASLGSRALRVATGMTLAWSTMRPVSAGKLAAGTAPAQASTNNPNARNPNARNLSFKHAGLARAAPAKTEVRRPAVMSTPSRVISSELHLRRALRGVARGELRHRL